MFENNQPMTCMFGYNQPITCMQVTSLNSDLNQLYEKRMKNGDPLDDKLTVFRQQVSVTRF